MLQKIGARTIVDAPCGDFHWLSQANLGVHYVGVDIVPDLVERNRRRYPGYEFHVADIATDDLPAADVVLCHDVLVHYDFAQALAILANLRRSGAEWLLTTTFPGHPENHDIAMGEWRPLNLERPPFGFPPPDYLIVEACTEGDGRYRDKALGLWRFVELDLDGSVANLAGISRD